MKKIQIAIAAVVMMMASAVFTHAQVCTNNGRGGQQGQSKGKKMGPRDGSGPIHTPGTGGGNGGGTRRGRR